MPPASPYYLQSAELPGTSSLTTGKLCVGLELATLWLLSSYLNPSNIVPSVYEYPVFSLCLVCDPVCVSVPLVLHYHNFVSLHRSTFRYVQAIVLMQETNSGKVLSVERSEILSNFANFEWHKNWLIIQFVKSSSMIFFFSHWN